MNRQDSTTFFQVIAVVVGFIIFGPIVLAIFAVLFYVAIAIGLALLVLWLMNVIGDRHPDAPPDYRGKPR